RTRGVERMVRRVGFGYAERVDPFDGGPHFTAPTDEVTLVQRTRKAKVVSASLKDCKARGLVAVELKETPFFRAVLASVTESGEGGCAIGADTAKHLSVVEGDDVWVLPLE